MSSEEYRRNVLHGRWSCCSRQRGAWIPRSRGFMRSSKKWEWVMQGWRGNVDKENFQPSTKTAAHCSTMFPGIQTGQPERNAVHQGVDFRMHSKKRKSAWLYEPIRPHQILALPRMSTLKKYIAYYKCEFEFNVNIFQAFRKKAATIGIYSMHGGLLVDELELSEHLVLI